MLYIEPAAASFDDAYVWALVFNASRGYATPTPIDPAKAPAVSVRREFSTILHFTEFCRGSGTLKKIDCFPQLILDDENDNTDRMTCMRAKIQ
jgi:hypothetical protein